MDLFRNFQIWIENSYLLCHTSSITSLLYVLPVRIFSNKLNMNFPTEGTEQQTKPIIVCLWKDIIQE